MLGVALVLVAAATAAGAESDAAAQRSASVARLADAVAARLLLADDVARYKWNHAQPVADPAREAVVLERTTTAAVALGIPHDYAQRVVAAQIAASRDRQQTLFDRWRRDQHGPFPEVPDLATAQRPALDRATSELLTRLQASMCDLDASARRALDTPPSALADATHAWSIAVAALWPTPSECRP